MLRGHRPRFAPFGHSYAKPLTERRPLPQHFSDGVAAPQLSLSAAARGQCDSTKEDKGIRHGHKGNSQTWPHSVPGLCEFGNSYRLAAAGNAAELLWTTTKDNPGRLGDRTPDRSFYVELCKEADDVKVVPE